MQETPVQSRLGRSHTPRGNSRVPQLLSLCARAQELQREVRVMRSPHPTREWPPLTTRLPLWLSWYRIRLQCRRPGFDSWVGKMPWRRERLPTPVFLGFPCGSAGKESTCNVGDLGSVPGLRRSPGEGKGYPLQCSGLENSMDCIV